MWLSDNSQAKDLSKRFSSSNDNYFISVEDVKLYEVAELRRGDLFCFNALLENKPIQYSVVSTMSCQLVRIDRLDLLKYDNQLNIQPTEEQYT
jgi:CRP-like cAMP-binding protein